MFGLERGATLTLFSSRCSAGICILHAYVLDQSMGRMLPKLPVIVHHILRKQTNFLLHKWGAIYVLLIYELRNCVERGAKQKRHWHSLSTLSAEVGCDFMTRRALLIYGLAVVIF